MAMANAENDKRAKKFIAKAVEKKGSASPRESAWIDALNTYYTAADNTDRRRRYVRDLEALVQNDPTDIEAKAFLALQIWKNGSWMTDAKKQLPISSHQAVDALLDQVFARRSRCTRPITTAFTCGTTRSRHGRWSSASLCGQTSPGIAHMWHMPGHTFSKLHRYADAAWQQEASARVDHAHMMRDRVLPDQIHNYAHNNEWLIRNLAFLGRVHDAHRSGQEHDRAAAASEVQHGRPRRHQRRLRPLPADRRAGAIRTVERDHRLRQNVVLPAAGRQSRQAAPAGAVAGPGPIWARATSRKASEQIAALDEKLKETCAARYAAADAAETKARGEKKSDADVAKAMADALAKHSDAVKNIENVLGELNGYAALAASDATKAKAEFEKVKDVSAIRQRSSGPRIFAGRRPRPGRDAGPQGRGRWPRARSTRWPCWSKCCTAPARSPRPRRNSAKLAPAGGLCRFGPAGVRAAESDRRRVRHAGRLARPARSRDRRRQPPRAGQPGPVPLAADSGHELDPGRRRRQAGRARPVSRPCRWS